MNQGKNYEILPEITQCNLQLIKHVTHLREYADFLLNLKNKTKESHSIFFFLVILGLFPLNNMFHFS